MNFCLFLICDDDSSASYINNISYSEFSVQSKLDELTEQVRFGGIQFSVLQCLLRGIVHMQHGVSVQMVYFTAYIGICKTC